MRIILTTFIVFGILVSLQGCITPLCGCSPPPTNRELIQGTWFAKEVSLNGLDVYSDWQNFDVNFAWEFYTTQLSSNEDVWPEDGGYVFAESSGALDVIERSDGLVIKIDYISFDEMQLSFAESNTGNWIFDFDREQ